jgi:two-component system, LuxR family, response regulator FixJ
VRQRLDRLTPRESEIVTLVVDGLSSKEIAAKLDVSFKTVEAHRAKIMRKMEASGVAQLVKMVVTSRTAGGTSAASIPGGAADGD